MATAAATPAVAVGVLEGKMSSSSSSLGFFGSRNCLFNTKWTSASFQTRAKGHRMQHGNHLQGQVLRSSKQHFLFKQLLSFATSEDQPSFTAVSSDTSLPQDKLDFIENSLCGSSSYLTERTEGKPGFVSFHGPTYQSRVAGIELHPSKDASKVVWFIGPTVLVAFLVIPSLYLRKVLSAVFEDSLLTDFLILFFTEALFYGGVAVFVMLVDLVWRPLKKAAAKSYIWSKPGYIRIISVATLVLSLIIPLLTMGLVWPWTGPASSATLAPYLVGIVVQFAFEQYARRKKSPAWPVIPIIFQVYRLHQLNRAAQLVTALAFSVRGAEATSQTPAITRSLGALLAVLRVLGVICVWSFASFLMRFLPPSDIPDP